MTKMYSSVSSLYACSQDLIFEQEACCLWRTVTNYDRRRTFALPFMYRYQALCLKTSSIIAVTMIYCRRWLWWDTNTLSFRMTELDYAWLWKWWKWLLLFVVLTHTVECCGGVLFLCFLASLSVVLFTLSLPLLLSVCPHLSFRLSVHSLHGCVSSLLPTSSSYSSSSLLM